MKNQIFLLMLSFFLINLGCSKKESTNPTLPILTFESLSKNEGNNAQNIFSVKIYLNKAIDKIVTIDYKTEDYSAYANKDYISKSGTLSIQPNVTEGLIDIIVLGDTIKKSDVVFKVILSNPTNATIENNTVFVTIKNDDTFVTTPDIGYKTPDNYTGYQLLWQDEFSGTDINSDNWGYDIGGNGWGNQELENYTSRKENSYVSDGKLVIEALRENYGGNQYTSARLLTKGKKEFTFGRIDIRAKIPVAQGIWPALWMLGSKISSAGWPACGEIDIMELVGKEPTKIYGTMHWGTQGSTSSKNIGGNTSLVGEDFSQKFHVFSIIWEKDSIEWLLDDKSYFKGTKAQVGTDYPFNEPFFFIFNVAVGGQWPGPPDNSTTFPQQMFVDYVRVFKKL